MSDDAHRPPAPPDASEHSEAAQPAAIPSPEADIVEAERQSDRRDVLKSTAAICLGAAALACPVAVGGYFALDPLLRRDGNSSEGTFRRVANLAAIEPGAPPRAFPIVADLEDAWSHSENVEIGSVLLFREADDSDDKPSVLAWSTICPHFGCKIDWRDEHDAFFCPCHSSLFSPSGERQNEISPRDMDRLETDVRDDAVWVRYIQYKTGTAQQIPIV